MKTNDLPRHAAPIAFTLNGRAVEAAPGETLLKAAQRAGVEVPHLCHKDGLRSPGNCRACVVEIEGERVLAPSCCRSPTPGMVVTTAMEPTKAPCSASVSKSSGTSASAAGRMPPDAPPGRYAYSV